MRAKFGWQFGQNVEGKNKETTAKKIGQNSGENSGKKWREKIKRNDSQKFGQIPWKRMDNLLYF